MWKCENFSAPKIFREINVALKNGQLSTKFRTSTIFKMRRSTSFQVRNWVYRSLFSSPAKHGDRVRTIQAKVWTQIPIKIRSWLRKYRNVFFKCTAISYNLFMKFLPPLSHLWKKCKNRYLYLRQQLGLNWAVIPVFAYQAFSKTRTHWCYYFKLLTRKFNFHGSTIF